MDEGGALEGGSPPRREMRLESQTTLVTESNVHVSPVNQGTVMALNSHIDTQPNVTTVTEGILFPSITNTTPMNLDTLLEKGEQKRA